ncbi:MAG: MBL fold metallo-hydrolase [Salipiger thiooxidans]|uniref:MBL fold metallo-hydrolase n=1 Tax=Salipiger thiooxidans TaxID=282683 RepID=UPI001CFA045B|nr:MBL fold metallo-hydrolase [Salipiger thiooxidans]
MRSFLALGASALCLGAMPGVLAAQDDAAGIRMTWFGITNWFYEFGDTGVLVDGVVSPFSEDDAKPNPDQVARVLEAMDRGTGVDMIFVGHDHRDHTFDTVEWARQTGAPVYTSAVACEGMISDGLPEDQCTPVYGGETIDVDANTTVRVVRWSHSFRCDADSNGGTEGIETFGFLFKHETADGPISWFMTDSGAGGPELVTNRIVDGTDYGAPLANLADAVRDADLTGFDLWQGGPESRVVNQARVLVPVFDIKYFMPQHYGARGGFDLGTGLHYAFDTAEMPKLTALMEERGVEPFVSQNYFDAYVYSASGLERVDNAEVKTALGLPASGPGPAEQGPNPRAGKLECAQD